MGVETVQNFKKTFNVGHGMERQDAKDWWVFMIPGIIVFVSWDDRFRITRENIKFILNYISKKHQVLSYLLRLSQTASYWQQFIQLVVFKLLSYCCKQTIRFHQKQRHNKIILKKLFSFTELAHVFSSHAGQLTKCKNWKVWSEDFLTILDYDGQNSLK